MKLETGNLNLGVLLLACCVLMAGAAQAASTNLNYSVAQINAGIGYGLANSNSVAAISNNTASIAAVSNNLNSGVAYIAFPGTQISSSWNENSWADIDLSAYCGSNSALVTLRVENLATSGNDVLFRTNGDPVIGDGDGASAANVDSSDGAYFQVPTDSSGVIEGRTDYAVEIYLECYIRANTFEE
jgi:hypothetical protein